MEKTLHIFHWGQLCSVTRPFVFPTPKDHKTQISTFPPPHFPICFSCRKGITYERQGCISTAYAFRVCFQQKWEYFGGGWEKLNNGGGEITSDTRTSPVCNKHRTPNSKLWYLLFRWRFYRLHRPAATGNQLYCSRPQGEHPWIIFIWCSCWATAVCAIYLLGVRDEIHGVSPVEWRPMEAMLYPCAYRLPFAVQYAGVNEPVST